MLLGPGRTLEEHGQGQRGPAGIAQSDWSWRRIDGIGSGLILALGTVAEHGLLRLLQSRGAVARHSRTDKQFNPHHDGDWPSRYALSNYGIAKWLRDGAWWNVNPRNESQARWKVLPVYHPSYTRPQNADLDYSRTRTLISRMMDST